MRIQLHGGFVEIQPVAGAMPGNLPFDGDEKLAKAVEDGFTAYWTEEWTDDWYEGIGVWTRGQPPKRGGKWHLLFRVIAVN